MSENSKIEWCDHTFNPWEGCTKVSPGCLNYYAETRNARFGGGTAPNWGKGKPRRLTSAANWKLPLKWNRDYIDACWKPPVPGAPPLRRPRVFCASLADWLDDEVPVEWLADLLDLIRLTPNLDWLLLTKRPQNWRQRVTDAILWNWCEDDQAAMLHAWGCNWLNSRLTPANVWIGTSVEDQARADERIPHLLDIPAKVRFLSCEPLLESLDLSAFFGGPYVGLPGDVIVPNYNFGIDWIICGGESGPGCRPFDSEWARSLRDQCKAASVPFFMKQMGGTRKPFPAIPDDLMIREFPTP